MEFKHQTSTLSLIFLLMMPGFALSDVNQDKAECSNQLVGLAPCLPYVGGEAKTPTIDCCSGLKQVLDKSKKCLCVLIKDKDDPSLGLKINGNSTSRPSSAAEKSDGGKGKRWVGVEMATGISLLIFCSIYRNIGV
ncbi:protein YLS3-like [Gossypium australe]|uniref:Protein YLS3-like n=1 Tax=Gossypium australe TaxID=47621 RepID=A0A5B6W951_9ROSI|nr:protein YLS3-like [Gossypium australe]